MRRLGTPYIKGRDGKGEGWGLERGGAFSIVIFWLECWIGRG